MVYSFSYRYATPIPLEFSPALLSEPGLRTPSFAIFGVRGVTRPRRLIAYQQDENDQLPGSFVLAHRTAFYKKTLATYPLDRSAPPKILCALIPLDDPKS